MCTYGEGFRRVPVGWVVGGMACGLQCTLPWSNWVHDVRVIYDAHAVVTHRFFPTELFRDNQFWPAKHPCRAERVGPHAGLFRERQRCEHAVCLVGRLPAGGGYEL